MSDVSRRSLSAFIIVMVVAACAPLGDDRPVVPVPGDPVVGRELIVDYGCGACHRIPGVPGARSLVGPPLDAWSRRGFIAGTLANSPDNLALFLADPDAVSPGTAMPNLGLDSTEIAAIVAYLYTLD